MAMQFKASFADGDEVARVLFGRGGFRRQAGTAGNGQRQRQCGGFDEVPAGSVSAAHNDWMHKVTEFYGKFSNGRGKTWTLRGWNEIFFKPQILDWRMIPLNVEFLNRQPI
jgi:hypothetical protein